jgi:type I restriction enzyme, R subunit
VGELGQTICATTMDHSLSDKRPAALQHQASSNITKQSANSPVQKMELMNAIMSALDAHHAIGTQALNSTTVQDRMADILLNHAGLYEGLRESATSSPPGL